MLVLLLVLILAGAVACLISLALAVLVGITPPRRSTGTMAHPMPGSADSAQRHTRAATCVCRWLAALARWDVTHSRAGTVASKG
jgi:hypothetical protein